MENEKPKITSKSWEYLTRNFLALVAFAIISGIIEYIVTNISDTYEINGAVDFMKYFFYGTISTLVFSYFAVKIHRNIILKESLLVLTFDSFFLKKVFKYWIIANLILIISYIPAVVFFLLTMISKDTGVLVFFWIMVVILSFFGIYLAYRLSYYLPYMATSQDNTQGFFSNFHKKTKNLFWIVFKPALIYAIPLIFANIMINQLSYEVRMIAEPIAAYLYAIVLVSTFSFAYEFKFK